MYYQERVTVIWIEKFKSMGPCTEQCRRVTRQCRGEGDIHGCVEHWYGQKDEPDFE